MSMRYPSIDCLPPKWREQAARQLGLNGHGRETKAKGKSKYGATRVTVDGIAFDSKRESRRYLFHKARHDAGHIKGFHRQVIFDLPGGVRYICDFLVLNTDGTYVFEDSKGVRTKEFAIKRRLVRATYGVEIELV